MEPGAVPEPRLRGRRVLLGVAGGIAAYKAVLVARLLVRSGASVDVVPTRGATHFVGTATFAGITGRPVRSEVWDGVEDETHVALARAADVVGIYPATAHTLARAAAGLADDLLTTSLLATTAPVAVAPAMHAEMWDHPATRRAVVTLRADGIAVVGPDAGERRGGDVGAGRVVAPETFVAALGDALGPGDLGGRRVLVSAGGTREPLDPVRFLGNRSSGRMGFALAEAARRRGADVDLVAAPTQLTTPPGVRRHDVVTARDLHAAVLGLADEVDVVVMAAAVADFRPTATAEGKLKKDAGVPTVELTANPDVLADLGERRRERGTSRPVLVGFAAETDDVLANGRSKLERKGADLLVVNDVGAPDRGFEVDTNAVTIMGADGAQVEVGLAGKDAVADRVLDEVVARL